MTQQKQHLATETGELDAWKRQESTFCVLHLVVLAVLLLVHTLFTAHFGVPSRTLVIVLAGAFLLRVLNDASTNEISRGFSLSRSGAELI